VVPYSIYFTSKLIITITELRYAALTLTLIAIGFLVVPYSLVFFAMFSRAETVKKRIYSGDLVYNAFCKLFNKTF